MSEQASLDAARTTAQQTLQEKIEQLLPLAEQRYFDAVVHLGVGPFVGKITFARQSPLDGSIMEASTITVPVSALIDLAVNIAKGFASNGSIEQLAAAQSAFIASARTLKDKEPL